MSANTNGVISRTTSSKRKADDEGLPVTKKKTIKRKAATGLIISQGPGLVRSSSALGHSSAPSASATRPTSALAQHPRTSHTPPTSDGESSRRPLARRTPPPSPPVPAVAAARARGHDVEPTPVRAPPVNRTGSVSRQPQNGVKGKGKARAPGIGMGLPDSRQIRPVLEDDAEVLENERWMAGQRSELDARERDNQRRAGHAPSSSRISAINFASSAMGSTPVQRKPNKPRPPANQSVSSSGLSRATLDSIEPVPISDTPVIVRNREIRQASQSRRRSSLSSRATPHSSVPPDTFFRHVDPDLPDALRLRQVLCWTSSRASDTPDPDLPPLPPHLSDILKSIQNAATKKLASGSINTAISPPQPRHDKPLAPNPRNVINTQAISRLEAYNQNCQAEDSAWSELIAGYNSQQATVVAALASRGDTTTSAEVELDETWRKEGELVRRILNTAEADDEGWMSDDEKEIVNGMRALEPKVDAAYESVYRATQFSSQASVYLDTVFASLSQKLKLKTCPASALAPRDETGRMLGVGGDAEVRPEDMLRAISVRGGKEGSGEKRAGGGGLQKVTPVMSAPTPRKAPGTPRASRSGVGARNKKR
ncbi:Mis12-Mtw1 family protein [Ceratobasidium sp. AG-Ba]|nr:Mis12-Mtw1 family protein [Ceratobasidium sp. AG-Ba]